MSERGASGVEELPAAAADRETARVEAFSDGVFAIAITLLVLELRVPAGLSAAGLRAALAAEWPSYFAFLTSFGIIGVMWINHHRIFGLMRRVDHALLVLNGLLLLGVSVVPFPTAVAAAYLGHPGAVEAMVLYCAVGIYIALAFTALWRYASSPARRPPLLRIAHDSEPVRALHEQYRFGPAVYVVALALALWRPAVSMGLCLAVAAFFAVPPRRPRAKATA